MRFGVLGPLAVWSANGVAVTVPEVKVRALLASLLVDPGRVVSTGRLAEDLWTGAPPADPAGAVQIRVSRLRKALGADGKALVSYRPPGYAFGGDVESVDAVRFARLTARAREVADARGRAALLTEALELWRGTPFAEFADAPFARAASARLEERRLAALEDLAEARLELGEHDLAAAELGELTAAHPRRERLRAAHMRALYRSGRQSEALDAFEELRRRLASELGVDPSPELATLHREILGQSPALAPPAPVRTNLPTPVTSLVGRDAAAGEVAGLLSHQRLVTLTGPGGVGKTRLAIEAASRAAASFPDGVRLVELSSLGRDSGTEVVAGAVAAILGIRDDGEALARLGEALGPKRTLLVLDNCEHLVEGAATLTGALLRAAPGLTVLATSRESLDIAGELLWTVPPLDPAGAAAELFAARATAASPGFRMTSADTEAVATICRRLDGIPLALELAATRVRALGVSALAGRLDDRFGVVTGGHRDAPARQRTLRAVIDWSWELLTAAERTVLRRLAVHVDGCTLVAAEAVCAADGVAPGDVLDLLARLVARSLVTVVHRADGPRYRLLESVAVYCAERLGLAGDERDARLAYARHHADLARTADARLRGADQRAWLARLDAESANLRGALEAAVACGEGRLALELATTTTWYWFLRGRLGEAERFLERALSAANGPAPHARAWLHGVRMLSGHPADGTDPIALRDAIADPAERVRAGWFLGLAASLFGEAAAAERLLTDALREATGLGDDWTGAAVLTARGIPAYERGDLAGAAGDAERARAVFAGLGDRWGREQALGVLARLAEIGGDYAGAERYLREGLRIAEELGLAGQVSSALSQLGRIALLEGDFEAADALHGRALRLAADRADKPGEENAAIGLGLAARRRGDLDAAERRLRPWLDWNRRLAPDTGAALILAELGFAAEQRGDAAAALELHGEGLTAARNTGDPRAVALAWEGLAGAYALAGEPTRAARLLGAAHAARDAVGAPLPQGERGDVDRIGAAVRVALGDEGFEAAFARGLAEGRTGVDVSPDAG
ncbi:BTAD domain-containing putative transcriptional regulator [Phytomonospora endophytica]|uniref:Putative ATPase/DNA-binding winged helix-turn-helix (WHTH) protein n=1 Tax=Phytomonospora endophytica TaxID=714109 RepID=A0A841FSD2_9ACTN|nr:BTAD domain-containing putative transcriptional regulator [Phytomonospora endophytica]MBB6039175.1 putative ATPase/DNA-binding winged helix-turn-helix (wHTH) protein [Phytomonospora endophytica]GIG67588.1 SARP family transcriptional regulator [Phytomonospora endophytica]